MLTRAVHRRQNLRAAQNAAEQLQLPWLCPALRSTHTTQAASSHRPVTARPKIYRSTSSAYLSTHPPKLASPVASPSLIDLQHGYTPFDFLQPASSPLRTPRIPLGHDLSDILMIDHSTSTGPGQIEAKKTGYIRGDALEIETTLDACLQIYQWNRAFQLLAQLNAIHAGNISEQQRVYNKVLEAMVYDHIWSRDASNVRRIDGWVENDMKKSAVPPNAQTFALKIKAAIATLTGRKRDRTVRRYWDMAKEYNVDWEVASLRSLLTDSDLGKLSEICPLELGSYVPEIAEPEIEEVEPIVVRDDVVSKQAIPNVRETAQKGLGLTSLRKSLALFSDATQLDQWEDAKKDVDSRQALARERQIRLEQDALGSAAERWRVEHEKMTQMGISGALSHGKVGAVTWSWYESLVQALRGEFDKIYQAELSTENVTEHRLRREYGPFLRLLEINDLAALTVTTVIQLMSKVGIQNSIKLSRLVADLGRTVEAEVETLVKRRHELRQKALFKQQSSARINGANNEMQASVGYQQRHQHINWSITQCTQVGSVLCELLFASAKIGVVQDKNVPRVTAIQQSAFEQNVSYSNGRKVGTVAAHQAVIELLTREPVADLIAKQLPMVCEPKPWSGYDEGGYFAAATPVLRIKNADPAQKEYTKAAIERGDMKTLFKGLDVLGQTGWRVNSDVFKVMVDAWNSGEAIANIPPAEKDLAAIPKAPEKATPKELYQHNKRVQAIVNEQNGHHSNRCFQNFQMEIAKSFLNETFYLPHNVDFRGRAYPVPPYLNQMGADNARGLLLFDQGRKLGEDGLRWLKIHLANVCGYDKASLSDRVKFAEDHMDDIRDSVQDPLKGHRWWLKADDAWQCLAVCFELTKAIDSGNPTEYVSHMPVHQDGTCNGLQHYAALGGDIAGARQVNLEPGDKPADVYSGVCELVKADIKKDAENGMELAKLLDDRVTRKIVKQTVMTNVYGVTYHGAVDQVQKQVDDILPDIHEKGQSRAASAYIARKIFKGLGTLFEGAHDIQYWFGDCAARITNSISLAQIEEATKGSTDGERPKSKRSREKTLAHRREILPCDFRSTVVWTTPLKLPVVQPYRVSHAQTVFSQTSRYQLIEPHITDSVDKRKQLQAFPPNFVHSLDATHMMLSAIEAKEQNISFSAVHDSFWTHAADVDKLNILLRDAFVRMHSDDIIGRLAAEFETRYKGHLYLAKVDANSPLATKIAAYRARTKNKDLITTSTKPGKTSKTEQRRQYHELMQEHKRQTLLNSENPEDVKKGQKMITAASIFESMQGEQYLKVTSSLGETATANVPEPQTLLSSKIVESALHHDQQAESHNINMEATLGPVISEPSQTAATKNSSPKATKASKKSQNSVWLWLPLTFKQVPKKGDWDVSRLKNSVYFFS